jgi:diguanylate cyclase (GGDEF)-like protein/PAS domain S-box-containing protein
MLANGNYDAAARYIRQEMPVFEAFDGMLSEDIRLNREQSFATAEADIRSAQKISWIALSFGGLTAVFLGFAVIRLVRERDDANILVETVLETLPTPVFFKDRSGAYLGCNQAFAQTLGKTPQELRGHTVFDLWPHDLADTYAQADQALMSGDGDQHFEGEGQITLPSGERRDVVFYKAVLRSARRRSVVGLVGAMLDITERKALERTLASLAHYDHLTGLPNRKLFGDRLAHALSLAPRMSRQVTVMFVDLDGFKAINDTLGHQAGDETLVTVAKRLKGVLRASDTVARLGGDEFALILEDCAGEPAEGIAKMLLAVIGEPIALGDQHAIVTGSIGISVFAGDADVTSMQLVAQADQAMYEAKHAGKNQYRFFAQMTGEPLGNLAVSKAVRCAHAH